MKSRINLHYSVPGLTLIGYFFALMLITLVAGCDRGKGAPPAPSNTAPVVAKVGPIIGVRINETPVLDGSKSFTAFSSSLSYNWAFTHKPDGSNAILNGETTAIPSFIADAKGVYTVQLEVSAKGITSERAIQVIVVTEDNERLTGPHNHVGLASECVNCHSGELVDPGKSPDHIGTSNMCEACHTPQGSAIIPFADHVEIFGNCSECHDGITAIGKSESHVETEAECDNCHNTNSFFALELDGSFDHSDITRSCSGCHNGVVSKGKHEGHLITDVECVSCHSKDSFLNAFPDHSDPTIIASGCDSCHGAPDGAGGLIANGPSVGHPAVVVDCVSCHTVLDFKMPGGIFNHRLLDATLSGQTCESCHNDNTPINAPAKSAAVPTHITTSADCGSCHNTESFSPAFGFDHTGVVDNCQTCHGNNSATPPDITATGKPLTTLFYEHMPTTPNNPGTASDQDCGDCHTPGTFSTGTYDHAGVVSNCNSCHNNVIGVGKLPNHIPTNPDTQDCADCHTVATFAGATIHDTATDTSDCLSCHDGNISKGKSLDHVTTDLNCSTCHVINNGFSTFANTFDHDPAVVSGDCASCHSTGIATPKDANHIPSQTECSQCHGDTTVPGGFGSNVFLGDVHLNISGGCEGCHISQFLLPEHPDLIKNNQHLPTDQDCDACHTKSAFNPSITPLPHTGITDNCTSCHDGSANNVAAGALGKTPTHPVTSADCASCHAIGNGFTDGTFDHTGIVSNCSSCHGDTTTATPVGPKKNAGHVITDQDCSICHVTGTFKNAVFDHTGIVDNCVSCHADPGAIAQVKSIDHVPTNEDCSICHNTDAFAGAAFDHTGIIDNCASCHDGATARGKAPPPNHVPTNDDCSVCHQTTGFIPGTFSHTGIVDNCTSCHDGLFATGKTINHVPTSLDCSVCHNTNLPLNFLGAVFDHTGIVDNCESCHNDSIAKGKDAKTKTFTGGTWVHDSSTANNCDTCHVSSGGATPKSIDHLNTNEQCDVCHTTDGWAPADFTHSPQGNYPGDHRVNPACTDCHTGSIGAGINSDNYPGLVQYAPFCAGCHAKDFEPKGDHIGGENGTVELNKNCATSGCHRVTDDEL